MSLPAVDLFVLLRVLVVVVGAESELSPADAAPEAAAVEEGEVFQGPDLVGRINRLFAAETYVLHVRALPAPKHCGAFLNGQVTIDSLSGSSDWQDQARSGHKLKSILLAFYNQGSV